MAIADSGGVLGYSRRLFEAFGNLFQTYRSRDFSGELHSAEFGPQNGLGDGESALGPQVDGL